jgi:hypothetical protein
MGSFHRDITGRGLHEPASYKVKNNTGSTLTKGTVVKRSGYDAVITVDASTNPVTDNRLGIILDDILDGEIGYVAASGDFGQFDTSSFAVDDVLYSTVSGGLSTTISGDPIATVLTSDATDGHLFCYVPLPIGSGGGGGGTSYTNYGYTLTPADISNGYITLPSAPGTPTDTVIQYEGAPSQLYGIDFTVAGALLTFTGMSGLVASGEKITVLFR